MFLFSYSFFFLVRGAIQANIKVVVVTIVPTESFLKILTVLAALNVHVVIMAGLLKKSVVKHVNVVNMVIK